MHDPRVLGSSLANKGYFYHHKWPLWPKADSAEFEKFIRYKQVVPLPTYLSITIKLSLICWIIFIAAFFIVWKKPSLLRLE